MAAVHYARGAIQGLEESTRMRRGSLRSSSHAQSATTLGADALGQREQQLTNIGALLQQRQRGANHYTRAHD